ncbi:unnamed protein product, partial [Porites lobata]
IAVADILVGAINMPLSALVEFVISRQVFNNAICQVDLVNVYLMFAFTGCSLYHLTLIAWERYQAIGKCFEYKAKMTKRRLKKLAKTAWFLAALTSIPGIVLTALEINHDFIIEAIAAFFALILIPYFYIMVYRETRKRKLTHITQITFLVKAKLENRVAITCALVSTAVILSFVPLVTVGLLGELYPVLRNHYVFRSTETLLQMNSIVNPLLYCYRNRRFRNIVLEKSWKVKCNVLNVSDPPQDLIKEKYAFSRRNLSKYLTRSASCNESAGSCGTSPRSPESLLKRSMSAPSSGAPIDFSSVVSSQRVDRGKKGRGTQAKKKHSYTRRNKVAITLQVQTRTQPVFSCPQSPNFVWDTTNEIFPWILVAIVSIASPAAIILNILTIAAVKSRKELQKNSNILLSSMAVADILVGAINMPLSALVEFVISRQVFNNAICQVDLVNVYLMFAFTGCSLYHLTLIAWERYQAIGKCFEYKAKMTKRRLKKLAITAWFLAAVTHIPGIVLTALGINHDFIIDAIAAFFALILIAYFYIMVYRETRKRKLTHITQITFLVKAKLENRVAITCALVSTAVILSFVPLVTVGLLGELYPVLRNHYVFRSTETLLQMNSIVNPLLYCYRNRRFRNIVLEILCIRNLPAAKTKVSPSQDVRLKDRLSSMEDTLEKPNVKYLTRSASCNESAGSCGTSPRSRDILLKRSMSAPSLGQIKSSCDDTMH